MKILYNIIIVALSSLVNLFSLFSSKIATWKKGTKGWAEKIEGTFKNDDRVIWIHCASLGEFEQGRPVIEAIKSQLPVYKIMLTFFSPSGYEVRKNYGSADCISYLPVDTPGNARKFIRLVNPELVIFVKYEFWNNYISTIYKNHIPLYLISGIFRPGQHFFKWYGSFFRKMLEKFQMIYVQDQRSRELLAGIGIKKVVLAGDTRFDRVVRIAASAADIPQIDLFRRSEKLFLAGSSWRPDEEIICEYINANPGKMKWIFAPHEIEPANIERLEKIIKVKSVRFSKFNEADSDARVMIIDNIGMLSSAYKYAYIAAVGGGFGKGIHNILEPACWAIPVIFGPEHGKFREAVELIKAGGAKAFSDFNEFKEIIDRLLSDENEYKNSAQTAGNYVMDNTGATSIIMQEIVLKDINKTR